LSGLLHRRVKSGTGSVTARDFNRGAAYNPLRRCAMLLEIDDVQREMLAAVIRRELDELGPEIHHTRTRSYRRDLKDQKEILEHLLDRLGVPEPAGR
jgi:hypothetical protein